MNEWMNWQIVYTLCLNVVTAFESATSAELSAQWLGLKLLKFTCAKEAEGRVGLT